MRTTKTLTSKSYCPSSYLAGSNLGKAPLVTLQTPDLLLPGNALGATDLCKEILANGRGEVPAHLPR